MKIYEGASNLANHKSAEKRARQNLKRRTRNRAGKTRIKNITKDVRLVVGEKSSATGSEKLSAAKSIIDKVAQKGVIHRKTASRKISRLSKLVNSMNA